MENFNVQKTTKKAVLSLTCECYQNLEKIETMSNFLIEKFMEDKDATIALEIIQNSAKMIANSVIEIQKQVKIL